jgi:hypothetical protein
VPATLGSFARSIEKEKQDDWDAPGSTGNLSESRSGCAALKRQQQEWLKNKHREMLSHGKKGETDRRYCKHSPRKRRHGGTPVGHSGQIALRREQCDL